MVKINWNSMTNTIGTGDFWRTRRQARKANKGKKIRRVKVVNTPSSGWLPKGRKRSKPMTFFYVKE